MNFKSLTPIYEKAWHEPQFKQNLLENPFAILPQEVITLSESEGVHLINPSC